jgi:Gnt-I system high-affinity gluconate transporter
MIILIIAFAIALQVVLTIKKVSPFLSLLIVSIIAAILFGMPGPTIIASIEKGVGSTLGGIALILCLGAVIGKILEASGAAEKIAITLIKKFGEKNIQWAMLFTGFLIGLPLYYNAGFIILVPLVFMLARKTGLPVLYVALPMAAALSTTHCFLPPHPGPVVLVNAFHANMGMVLMYGILIAIPAVIVAGPLLAVKFRHLGNNRSTSISQAEQNGALPKALPSFCIALLPVFLITLSVLANAFLSKDGVWFAIISFIGNTNIALLITTIAAIYFFGIRKQVPMVAIMKWVSDGVSGIAMIMLIITAGGVFKQVLTDSGTGDYIATFSSKWQMHPLLFAWVVTALLRVTIGSATVAAITAAGIVGPLITNMHISPELMVLAVGSGSVFGSHINDSGFWMFKEFFQLSLKQTFLSWTVMETTISVIGLIGVMVIDYFIA